MKKELFGYLERILEKRWLRLQAELGMGEMQAELDVLEEKIMKLEQEEAKKSFRLITGYSLVDEVLKISPKMEAVFQDFGLVDCSTCSVRFDENLLEVASAYSLSLELLISTLHEAQQ